MRAFSVSWSQGRVAVSTLSEAAALVSTAIRPGVHATIAGSVFGGGNGQTAAEVFLRGLSPEYVPAQLPNGDYAGVLCTPSAVYLFRDAQARVPLYLRIEAGRVVEASTALSMIRSARNPDRRYLCHYLAGVDAGQQHVRRTPFTDVQRVLAGETLEVGRDGAIVRSWETRMAGPTDVEEQAAPRALRGLLRDAVAHRLGETTACHLSGGLDSTSVALIAADEMRGAGKGNLCLVSARYKYGELASEAEWIDTALAALRRVYPAAQALTVPGDEALDFDHFEAFAGSTEEPYAHAFRAPLMSRLSAAAAQAGCCALLTGCGSEPVVDGTPLNILELVRRGHLAAAARAANDWADQTGSSRPSVAMTSVIRPAMPLLLDRWRRAAQKRGNLGGLGPYVRPPWVRPEFAWTNGYATAARAEARARLGRDPVRSLYTSATYTSAPDGLSWAEATRLGFLLSHPFLDRDLVALMASLPAACRASPHKPLLRNAMSDLVPQPILSRLVKVPFDEVYQRGLQKNYSALVELCRSAEHPLIYEIFDIDVLCQTLREATLGVGDAVSTHRLNASLALLVWLDQNG